MAIAKLWITCSNSPQISFLNIGTGGDQCYSIKKCLEKVKAVIPFSFEREELVTWLALLLTINYQLKN